MKTIFLKNYKMTLAYDGTQYSGWQIQPNGISIQAKLQEALKILLKEDVIVTGSGRTDAGVHALGQVAHFHSPITLNVYRFLASINGLLPYDIRVQQIEEVPLKFHAQHSAVGKTYFYHLCLKNVQNPFRRLYSWHLHSSLDIKKLEEVCALFIGTRDFTSFANEAHKGSAAHDPIRTLKQFDVVEEEDGVRLELTADGFLYKMVRNIVGTAIEVTLGKRCAEEIPQIFELKDRRHAGQAAPCQGLFLMHVDYPMMPLC